MSQRVSQKVSLWVFFLVFWFFRDTARAFRARASRDCLYIGVYIHAAHMYIHTYTHGVFVAPTP